MKSIVSIVCSLFVTGAVYASEGIVDERQEKQQISTLADNARNITPVIVGRYYMGGVVGGEFISGDDFYDNYWSYVSDTHYKVYVEERYLGRATAHFSWDEYSDEFRPHHAHVEMISPTAESDRYSHFDFVLNADWDLFPRPYKEQDTRQPTYQRVVEEILRDEGMDNPKTVIKQLIRVDLDGDGAEEVLIVAGVDHDVAGYYSEKGDHSIVIMRKLTDGLVWEQVVARDLAIEGKQQYSGTNTVYSLESIADINGDGVMEVVLSEYSGGSYFSLRLYQLIDDKLKLIAWNGDGN